MMACFCIPQRWIIVMMGFFAFFNAYALRSCLSFAITRMAKPLNRTEEMLVDACPPYSHDFRTNSTAPVAPQGAFEWSEYTQGIILSSFYWGYVLTHLPGGLLAERYGPKYTMGLSILFIAVLTVITPAATIWGDANALISLRFLMGLGGGMIQPTMSCLLSQWVPANERSFIGSIVYTGIGFGIVISSIISGLILEKSSDDWPSIFYLFGGVSILWFVLWMILGYDNPRVHPFITENERNYLEEQLESHTHKKPPPFPWKHVFTSKSFIALIIMQSGSDWCSYITMTDLPKYMDNVLRLPIQLNGYASSVHQIGSWIICIIMSWLSDWLVGKRLMKIVQIRKTNTVISSLGPGVLLISAMYVGCDVVAAVSLITVGLSLVGCSIPGMKVNVLDLSPNYAGTLMGICNGIGAFMGILAPYMVGVLAPNQTLAEWKLIFWIVTVVYLITTVNFLISASGEVQYWNDPKFLLNGKEKENDLDGDTGLLPVNKVPILVGQ